MPYFQNPFNVNFLGVMCLSDRQYNITFKVGANRNTSTNMVSWAPGPYALTGTNKFAIRWSADGGRNYATISFTLTAGSAVSADQVVTDMNANANFAAVFTASVFETNRIRIVSDIKNEFFRAYIPNTTDTGDPTNTAEQKLLFNKYAPVVELPTYFDRHTVANVNTYSDSTGSLIKLTQTDENWVITNAGLSTTAKNDYELMRGRSGLFTFTKNTVDGSNRVTTKIEYPAGAIVGDFAKKTTYAYTSSNTTPDKICEVPYTLTNSDLVTP